MQPTRMREGGHSPARVLHRADRAAGGGEQGFTFCSCLPDSPEDAVSVLCEYARPEDRRAAALGSLLRHGGLGRVSARLHDRELTRSASINAIGFSMLTRSCRSRTGNPTTWPCWPGARSMLTIPCPDPFTSHRPARPCTPRLSGLFRNSLTEVTEDRKKRARKAPLMRTRTSSPSTSTNERDGAMSRAAERILYALSKRMGKRITSRMCGRHSLAL